MTTKDEALRLEKQATPHNMLIEELLSSLTPKTEREHAAAREIEKLRAALAEQDSEPGVLGIASSNTGRICQVDFDHNEVDDKVICPSCTHQFRAIPCNVQKLMLGAGFEPPFTKSPAVQTLAWINPNDKTQAKFLPNIGEPVWFCYQGETYFGKHTGGSFVTGHGITQRHFPTWECLWVSLPKAPAAHGIGAPQAPAVQPLTDEQKRVTVQAIKTTLYKGGSSVQLPADSWIEAAFIEALKAAHCIGAKGDV